MKKIKTLLTLIFLFVFTQNIFAQFKHQMLSTYGSTSKTSSGIVVTQTIGQTSVNGFYSGSSSSVSQGYQQSIDRRIISNLDKLDIQIFPNPFLNEINISYIGDEALNIRLFDVTGKLVYSSQLIFDSYIKAVDMKRFPAGFYFVELISKTASYNTKLIKQ